MPFMRSFPARTLTRLGLGVAVAALAVPVAAPAVSAAPTQQQCGSQTAAVAPTITPSRTTIGKNETATVTVTGSNYLVPRHVCGTSVFGGIYLFFGWVQPGGGWGPSFRTGNSPVGLFGQSYSYPGEGGGAETRDDGTGTVRLISFTLGGESGEATDFHMDSNGNWSADLVVRGSTYSFVDVMTGKSATVDCTVVQCGVYTIGAHGKASATNEQFHPINFTDDQGRVVAPSAPNQGAQSGGSVGASGNDLAGSGGSAILGGNGSNSNSGSNGNSSSGNSSSNNGSGSSDAPADTVGGEVGTVGESSTETTAAPQQDEDDVLDSQDVAAQVQSFGDDDSSGSGAVIGAGVAVVVIVAGGAGAMVMNRRKKAAA